MPPVPRQEGDVRVHPIPAVQPEPALRGACRCGHLRGRGADPDRGGAPVEPLGRPRRRPRGDPGRPARSSRCSSTRARARSGHALLPGRRSPSARSSCRCTLWSAEHEPALSGEMLYIWLGLYAAYFFSTAPGGRAARLHGGRVPRVSCATTARCTSVAAGWLTLVGILFPAAGVLRARARRRDPAREPPLRGRAHRHAHRPQEPPRARPRAARRGRARAALGRAAERRDRRPRLLQVRERPPRPPRRRRGARARRTGAAPAPPRRATRIARTGGEEFTILLPGATEHEAYLVAERHARRGRARVPQRPRGAHVLVRRSPPTPTTAARRTP